MVEQDGGRIKHHMTLDAYRDCIKYVKDYSEIMKGNGSGAVKASAA